MRIVKFPWVKHTEGNRQYEIYSLSVSPDGLRLATGGLDGKIKIWSIETFYKFINNKNQEGKGSDVNSFEHRPLCSMSRHEGAITCVRFSNDNRFLATGSDDKLILIWEKDEEKSKILQLNRMNDINSAFNNDLNESDFEHWTLRKRLVAHDNDIQDMAWSPDNSILVSVGLDRSIIIWNALTFEKIKRFEIHQSHVKGVVFDPAGKYFATCSDDRSMRIFRYSKSLTNLEFSVEKIISAPFMKAPLTTYFRRCSWSPNGLYIAAPNGTNEGINANILIKRGSWEHDLSLVGHRLPCEVCSFSPRLYDINGKSKLSQDDSQRLETVIITAGQDKTLTLWSSGCATPLSVVTDISAKTITDISWNPNGLNVYLCGLDGIIISVFFDESELGKVVPLEENNDVLLRYGKDRDMFFPESVEQLRLEDLAEKKGIFTNEKMNRISNIMSSGHNNFTDPSGSQMKGSSLDNTTKTPTMNVLIPRSKKHPNKKMPVPITNQPPDIDSTAAIKKPNVISAKRQKITITKSGKKRVTPILLSASSTPSNTPSSFSSTSASSSSTIDKRPKQNKLLSIPYPPLPKNGVHTLVSSIRTNVKHDLDDETMDSTIDYIAENEHHHHSGSALVKKGKKSKSSNGRIVGNFSHGGTSSNHYKGLKSSYPEYMMKAINSTMTIFGDRSVDDVLIEQKLDTDQIIEVRFEDEITYKINDINNEEVNSFFEEFNFLSRINAKENKTVWDFYINEKITCIGESNLKGLSYWCFSTENGKVFIVSTTGRQLFSTIQLGSNVIKMICHEGIVMCICSNSLIYSWKFENLNGFFKGMSIIEGAPISVLSNSFTKFNRSKKKIEYNSTIRNILMLKNGAPLISLCVEDETKEILFTYDLNLNCWIQIFDSWYLETVRDMDEIAKELNRFDVDRIIGVLTNRIVKKRKISTYNSVKKDNTEPEGDIDTNAFKQREIICDSWKSNNATVIESLRKLT